MMGISTPDKIRARLSELSRLEYDHDEFGGFSMRPDAYALVMDAVTPRNPFFNLGRAGASVDLRGTGVIMLRFSPSTRSGRELLIDVVDGSTMLCTQLMPSGGRVRTCVKRPLGGEADARAAMDSLFAWLNEEVR